MLPKLVITDIDGVWTDGGIYYDETGNEFKKFNTSDSAGVLFCRLLNIPVCIMTGEDVKSVRRRSEKLKVDYYYPGAKNKLMLASNLCTKLKITLDEVAFIGDDINDLQLLKVAGISGSVPNAPAYIRKHASLLTMKSGGQGAFREFIELILEENDAMDLVLQLYSKNLEFEQ